MGAQLDQAEELHLPHDVALEVAVDVAGAGDMPVGSRRADACVRADPRAR
jgi:hypothetical protein